MFEDVYSEVQLNLSDVNDFPTNLSPDEMNTGAQEISGNAPPVEDSNPQGPSFAQMLKNKSSYPSSTWGQPKPEKKETGMARLMLRLH